MESGGLSTLKRAAQQEYMGTAYLGISVSTSVSSTCCFTCSLISWKRSLAQELHGPSCDHSTPCCPCELSFADDCT